MDLEQTVRAAFELREPAPDFEDVVMARLSAGTWRASQATRRRPRRIVLGSALFAVAAAAAVLVVQQVSAPRGATSQGSALGADVSNEALAMAGQDPRAPGRGIMADDSSGPQITVALLLDEITRDATGRDYGQRVYERAREELRMLPRVVLVDADTAGAAAPAFRITYINLAESGGSAANVVVEMVFQVEALQRGAGAGAYKPVFRSSPPPPGVVYMPPSVRREMIPSFEQDPPRLLSSARLSVRPGVSPTVPADCFERSAGRCPYTPADIAAFTILSWYLQGNAPDVLLDERLHAMLRDQSSPPGLWLMALVNLQKYGKLRLGVPELLAAIGRVGDDDPELADGLVGNVLEAGNRTDLMRELRNLLLVELPNGDRSVGSELRRRLVTLLATKLENEPDTRGILESVAATDPEFDVRAAARLALGIEPESRPQPRPTPSFMGPTDEEVQQ